MSNSLITIGMMAITYKVSFHVKGW